MPQQGGARMNKEELIKKLSGYEWKDFEAKEARHNVPKDVYESVSAFANASGGHIIFGVKQAGKEFEISGVAAVDNVQNQFLSTLRNRQKISYVNDVKESMHQEEDKVVLLFFIPKAPREWKPVYLNGNINYSYIRKGACDHKCTNYEIGRFLRNANNSRFDSQPVRREIDKSLNPLSLKWYRDRFQARNPSSSLNALEDLEFLEHWGLITECDDKPAATTGCILLFGTGSALRSILSRPLAEIFLYRQGFFELQPDDRWLDRRVFEGNLIEVWMELMEWYMQRRMARFDIDPDSLERTDQPEDYVSFREAAVNLITHQDFEEASHKASIAFYADRLIFRNPGYAFEDREALLRPGDKPVRNPLVVEALRRVGIGERAGTGIRAIFQDWRRLGRVPPVIENDSIGYEFRLFLMREELFSERQILFQASIGVHLSDDQAAVLALLCRSQFLSLTELTVSLGRSTSDVRSVIDFLVTQVLACQLGDDIFALAPHLRVNWPIGRLAAPNEESLVSDQAPPDSKSLVTDQASGHTRQPAPRLTPPRPLDLSAGHRALLFSCDTPRALKELMEIAGVKHRANFKTKYVQPLVDGGLLQLQFPDRPTHPSQRYVLTEAGAKLVGKWHNTKEETP
jgi:ATP-dependent DNA helicase RecG